MVRLSRLPAAILLAATLLIVAGCSTGDNAVAQGDSFQFVSPGGKSVIDYPIAKRKRVKDFTGQDLITGKQVSLDEFSGDVVLINMWASWCGPCRTEVDGLEAVYNRYRSQGFTVLGIAIRDPNKQGAQDFYQNHSLTYPSLYDESLRSLIGTGWPVQVVPTTLIVDRQHRAASAYIRAVGEDEIDARVRELLAEPGPSGTAPVVPVPPGSSTPQPSTAQPSTSAPASPEPAS